MCTLRRKRVLQSCYKKYVHFVLFTMFVLSKKTLTAYIVENKYIEMILIKVIPIVYLD